MRSNFDSFRILPLHALSAGTLPRRMKLFGWGSNDTTKGSVVLNEVTRGAFAANQRRLGRERVAVDFEHNTVEGAPEYARSKEPRPVAGFGAPRLIPGDGLYLEGIVATPEGERNVANYEDISPATWLADDGTLLGLHSVALCRAGAVFNLTLAAASLASFSAAAHPAYACLQRQKTSEATAYAEACVEAQLKANERRVRALDLMKSRKWSFTQAWDYLDQEEKAARWKAEQG